MCGADPEAANAVTGRGLHLVVVIAFVVAIVGAVFGVRGTGRAVQAYVAKRPPVTAAPEARSYSDMRRGMHGPNAKVQPAWWEALPQPDVFAAVVQTVADREAALARRATRRAFEGAPPMIPHAIDQVAISACLSCHEHGTKVANLVAPAMSHPVYGSCVQCHVATRDPLSDAATSPPPVSTFVGVAARTGERAWPGAPPTIPHSTWMRDRCESCHGVFGSLGMRSTHPWRQSCTQCHAPSAALDQRAAIALGGAP